MYYVPHIVLCLMLVFSSRIAAEQTIKIWHENAKSAFVMKVINAALDEVGFDGQFEVVEFAGMNQAFEGLARNENAAKRLDIIVSGVNKKHEADHLPVYRPFEKGLLGFRVCIINQNQQDVFNDIKTVSDFIDLNAEVVLVKGWPDIPISTKNGLPVKVTSSYKGAIEATQKSSPACFSRSVIEVRAESVRYPKLSIENHLALVYPFTDILYVSRHNKLLYKKLSRGMKAIGQNGVHRAIFEEYYGELLESHNFYDRKLIILNNPDVSDAALEAINKYGVASFFYGK